MDRLRQLPIVSGALVIVNVAIFILCDLTGNDFYSVGGLRVYDVLGKGEYGRIISALFLHEGITHISNNMLILFFLGAMIEKEVGHVRYGLLYFLSGIGGNLLSLWVKVINKDISMSIGASGAVFGLDGVLLAMVLFSDRKMDNVTPGRVFLMIILSLYSGVTGENIDNAAHVGGLITGFAAGSIMCLVQRRRHRKMQIEDGRY